MPGPGAPPRLAAERWAALVVVLGMGLFVVIVYVIVVLGGAAVASDQGAPHPLLSIAATTIVALTFEPVRSWLARRAARLTHTQKSSPYEILRGFCDAFGGTHPAEELPTRMASTLVRGTDAEWAEIWLDIRGQMVLAGAWPEAAHAPRESVDDPAVLRLDVRYAGELLGEIRLRLQDGRELTPVEDRLVHGLAGQAGLVLRGVRLRTALSERLKELSARAEELRASRRRIVAAQDEERRKLERDIHDGAQQHLLALTVNLRLAQSLAHRSPARAAELLGAQVSAACSTLDAVVDLSRGIYPSALTQRGLPEALLEAGTASSIAVRVEADQVPTAPADVEAALYFTCLEALQNAAKHSGAAEVRVRLVEQEGRLCLTVEDDGRGFDPGCAQPGSGLANMADRMDAVGGSLTVDAAPSGGVRVSASVAVGARDEA